MCDCVCVCVFQNWRVGHVVPWGPSPTDLTGPNRTCITSRCLNSTIDEWFNGTNGAGYQFDMNVRAWVYVCVCVCVCQCVCVAVNVCVCVLL